VQAATVRLWPGDDERSCCSPGALQRARESANALGLTFHLVDQRTEFEQVVVDGFVAAYVAGETPNPCVDCNPLRLARLVEFADELGIASVATGHYARIVWQDGEAHVGRGADLNKDQSYMLWRVAPETLARLRFPLGEETKPAVRERAASAALAVASEPESQEVCFAPRGYQKFLASRGVTPLPGAIVAEDGQCVGEHQGHWLFTIGQRRGLGIAASEPTFVLARRPDRNELLVGPRESLESVTVELRDVVDSGLGTGAGLEVQLRYNSKALPVKRIERHADDRLRVELTAPFDGPAPGQSAVFYRDDVVVGGGIITLPDCGGERGSL